MTVKYTYTCLACNHDYIEMRPADEPQIFTTCNSCGKSEYEEISAVVISDTVERVAAPEPIEETPAE